MCRCGGKRQVVGLYYVYIMYVYGCTCVYAVCIKTYIRMCICTHTHINTCWRICTRIETHIRAARHSCEKGVFLSQLARSSSGSLWRHPRIEILRTTMILNNSFGCSHAVSSIIGIVQSFSYALGLAVRLRSFWSGLRCCTPRPGRLAQRFQGVH